MCRFHTQTAGCSLTAQQPYNNVIRTTLQALAAVLGGTNSLHTNSLDEAWALPTEEAVQIALRTQQIIAHESGVINTVDPLGGSYFLESLTREMEVEVQNYFDEIDRLGGMISAIEKGYPQREIQDAAYLYQKAIEEKRQVIPGVNEFTSSPEAPIEILQIGEEVQNRQKAMLGDLRRRRDGRQVVRTLDNLRTAARGKDNLMPFLIEAVREYATLGEMCSALKDVFGVYTEPDF
jgi:methylmalonyl-CoA mutase N-terminal domain/subunit